MTGATVSEQTSITFAYGVWPDGPCFPKMEGRDLIAGAWERKEVVVTSPLRILLLEDEARDAELIQERLEAEGFVCETTRVQTRAEFLAALENDELDIILADYKLPSFDGLSALKLAHDIHPALPFIFVSGTLGEEVAIEALKVGATDYVLKTRLARLAPAVLRAVQERSERKKSEEALRRSEKELRDVIETIPAMAFTTSADGSSLWINKQWVEFSGQSVEDASGAGWQSAVHPDDLPEHVAKWRNSIAIGEPFENEARHRAATGEHRWFLVRAVPLRDERGTVLRWYGTLTDIEDRKRAELERERLRQLEADLAHLNRVSMMGELAASLGHEIGQPVTAALANAQACARWLQREPPEIDQALKAVARVAKEVDRAAEIIQRNRSLYRRAAPERKRIDLNQLIQEMAVLLHEAAAWADVSIRAELDPELPGALADRVQLQQVLMNLMLNAIEAMKGGGGRLKLVSGRIDESQLLVSVTDTGVGLPADDPERIFEAFYTSKPQGTGMGLSISRRIIESHGGRLWATPNVPRGAVFHLTLPSNLDF
jgi:PAS domain S-box-containing protein